MPVATANDFLEALRRSELLEPDALDTVLAAYPGSLDDPGKLAEYLIDRRVITKFQAKALLNGRYKGLIIGPYKILDKIGAGGMGIVYLAEHTKLHRRVAIKVLPEDKTKDKLALERFYREARAVAALDHPNIVRAFDVAEHEGMHYLVMEYIDGANLQRYLDTKGPLPWKTAVNVAMQACKGLQQANDRGLVHRDIKPANILVDKAGMVKILDLGLARSFDEKKDNLTQDLSDGKDVMGSIDYIAPEQAIASKPVDIRADIYSLGATLYTLITGRPPVEGTTAQKLLQHQVQMPTPVHKLKPDVPEGISTVMAKMMAKKPEHRYATPNDVIAAFTPFVTGQTQLFPQLGQNLGTGPLRGQTSGNVLNPNSAPVPTAPLLREVGQSAPTGPLDRDTSRIKKTKKLKRKRQKAGPSTLMIVICTAAVLIPIVCLLFVFLSRSKDEGAKGAESAKASAETTNPQAAHPRPGDPANTPAPPPGITQGTGYGSRNDPRSGTSQPENKWTPPPNFRPRDTYNPRSGWVGNRGGPGGNPGNLGPPHSTSGGTSPENRRENAGGSPTPPPRSEGTSGTNQGGTGIPPNPGTLGSPPPVNNTGSGTDSGGGTGAGTGTGGTDSSPPPLGSRPPGFNSGGNGSPTPPYGSSHAYPPMTTTFRVQEGLPMANIVGEDMESSGMRLSDFEGQVVLIDFWGFWNPASVKSLPYIKQLSDKYKGRPFVVLGVNTDTNKAEYEKGMKKHEIPWRSFKNRLTDGSTISRKLQVQHYPSLILVDRRGVVRKVVVNSIGNTMEFEGTIEKLIERAERPGPPR